jgi:hypothetical protein
MERSFDDPLENYGHACIPMYHVYHVYHVYHIQAYTVIHRSGPRVVPVANVCVTHVALVKSRRIWPFLFFGSGAILLARQADRLCIFNKYPA